MGEDHRNGFTLVEVIIVLSLMGLVAAVVAFAITTALRTSSPTTARVDDARSLQGLVTWFPRDVASTPASPSNIGVTPTTLVCSGSETEPGDNLLELRWSAAGKTYVAGYRLEGPAGERFVRRYSCSSPFADTSSLTLTADIASAAPDPIAPPYDVVAIQVQTVDGQSIRVDATPRNPNGTLPATTTAPTLPPPTTTSTTTTTVAPPTTT